MILEHLSQHLRQTPIRSLEAILAPKLWVRDPPGVRQGVFCYESLSGSCRIIMRHRTNDRQRSLGSVRGDLCRLGCFNFTFSHVLADFEKLGDCQIQCREIPDTTCAVLKKLAVSVEEFWGVDFGGGVS